MTLLAKVCGLVHKEDAALAAAAGADLLGFVHHGPSPRHCADLSVAEAHLERAVLVGVAEDPESLLETARQHGFRRIQPHLPAPGRALAVRRLREAGLFVLLPWADAPDQEPVAADLYLWEPDPAHTGVAGGSGLAHPMAFPPPGPFLLAGGLDAGRVEGRIAALPPAIRGLLRGADAASRLESTPGRKDPDRVTAFIHAVHALEHP